MDLAAGLMRDRGYNGVSLRMLASEMGVTEPTFYHYFKSKDELLYAMLNQGLDNAIDLLESSMPHGASAAANLRHLIFLFTKGILENLDAFTIYFQDKDQLSSERAAELTAKERRFVRRLAEVIRLGIETGECRGDVDPVVAALTLIGASAWVYKWYDPEGPLTREQLSEQIAKLSVESCLTQRGRQALLNQEAEDGHER
jgi:AcrR family transcriptional regulator